MLKQYINNTKMYTTKQTVVKLNLYVTLSAKSRLKSYYQHQS